MKPSGGTELQHNFLEQHVSKDLLDKFQICTSVPGKVPLSKDKDKHTLAKNGHRPTSLSRIF